MKLWRIKWKIRWKCLCFSSSNISRCRGISRMCRLCRLLVYLNMCLLRWLLMSHPSFLPMFLSQNPWKWTFQHIFLSQSRPKHRNLSQIKLLNLFRSISKMLRCRLKWLNLLCLQRKFKNLMFIRSRYSNNTKMSQRRNLSRISTWNNPWKIRKCKSKWKISKK